MHLIVATIGEDPRRHLTEYYLRRALLVVIHTYKAYDTYRYLVATLPYLQRALPVENTMEVLLLISYVK